MVSVRAFIVLLIAAVIFSVDAYRKPPFNGSIFGKRSGTAIDYENTGRALNAMCEIASEACGSWFPQQESN
ncbi:SIFamide-related peptide isoform X2 [Athalia rosae]|nr:SIFamide-related peptide isoform X2 [Athalia rosae]XP_048504828.1 SIFamide-related peptide isoform X2 [Athalia rosae]